MADPASTDVVRRLYEAINRRDAEAGFAMLAPEFEWEVPERSLLGGTHRGHGEVREALFAELEVFDVSRVDPEELFEGEDRVVAFVRQTVRGGASGAPVEIRIGHLWTLRGGKAVRLQVFPEREQALEAAGLGPSGTSGRS